MLYDGGVWSTIHDEWPVLIGHKGAVADGLAVHSYKNEFFGCYRLTCVDALRLYK